MAAKADKLGPGLLKFGATGSEIEFGVSCRQVTLEPSVDEGDIIVVLSGDEIDDGETETYALTGSVFQSYDLQSLLVWAHVNAGAVVQFRFDPRTDGGFAATGTVKVRRINIGGKVDERNETDFSFPGRQGMYSLIDADTDDPITVFPPPAPPGP